MTMTVEQFAEVIRLHKLWLIGDPAGVLADLYGADLRSANLPGGMRVVCTSGIGSDRRTTQYRADKDAVQCGCFLGTLDEFATKIEETHKNNPMHLAHYRAMIAFFRVYKEVL